VRSLAVHGVELVFGIPGTHNLELYAHLERHGIRHVSPRHEQGAGYAADGFARATGRPGVAVTTAGPALMNVAAAAGQAQSDSVPLLVVAPGMPRAHPAASTGYLHEMPSQQRAMSGVVERSVRVMSHAELGRELADAFAAFRSRRPRARYVEVPLDLLGESAEAGPATRATIGATSSDATKRFMVIAWMMRSGGWCRSCGSDGGSARAARA
jgi:5-guanidino-2-oxopentanoate decarboxylase